MKWSSSPVVASPLLLQLSKVVAGPFICVKSSKDTRYSDHWIVTHGGGCVRCVPFHSLAEFKAHMGMRWHKIQVRCSDTRASTSLLSVVSCSPRQRIAHVQQHICLCLHVPSSVG